MIETGADVEVVVVGNGADLPELPEGAGWGEAAEALGTIRLEAVRVEVFSETVPAGQVVALDPPPGRTVCRPPRVGGRGDPRPGRPADARRRAPSEMRSPR